MSAINPHDGALDRRSILLGGTSLAAASAVGIDAPFGTAQAQPATQSVMPSPGWTRAMPSGPDARLKITEEYARLLARDAFFWTWPMVNIYNRRLAFAQATSIGLVGGLPFSPLNRLSMLHDYVEPQERDVACPNQDVVYGASVLALDISPVVIQVPDFADRFWVYQIVDLRTDSFASLGKMYGTSPGFYMLVGPNWQIEVPKGITNVFRSKTNTGFAVPRVFMDDSAQDREAIQPVIGGIDVYPLADFDGTMKRRDWRVLQNIPKPAGAAETRWVFPEKVFDQLPAVLSDAPPLPGEEARYAQLLAVFTDGSWTPPSVQRAN